LDPRNHVHADHLTAAPYIKAKAGGRIGIGEGVVAVQKIFATVFNADPAFILTAASSTVCSATARSLRSAGLRRASMATPGHTPACVTYVIGDAAFVGDNRCSCPMAARRAATFPAAMHSFFLSLAPPYPGSAAADPDFRLP